jgi:hypothetical protein
MILSQKNKHPRDDLISFYEIEHKYKVHFDIEIEYTSVTTWCHSHFEKFDSDKIIENMMIGRNWNESNKYWGLTSDEIKKIWSDNGKVSSQQGTNLHNRIEHFMNHEELGQEKKYTHYDLFVKEEEHQAAANQEKENKEIEVVEWDYFIHYLKEHPTLIPYRTEWVVFEEDLKIAGCIDMVYENEDGTLSIYDWKRCKEINDNNPFRKFAKTKEINHMPDTNYWHYALQLNVYKYILENKYDKIIKDLFLVRLHPESEDYDLISIPFLTNEIEVLFLNRKKNM